MLKYSNYIALSPYYESVVDIESETRNPNLWQEYIVHEDMKEAIDKICMSLKYEDKDKRRSFWIHGAYGTGKSYAAIVLKHLFEDSIENVESFLSKEILIPCRERFLSLRRKGEFLVIWKSQAGEIRSGTELLMTMETAIRDKLREKFGDNAYFGRNSLSSAAKDAVRDSSVNWEYIFRNSDYRLDEEYDSFSDFKQEVLNGSIAAARKVAGIYRSKGWGLFDSLAKFKAWVADVIDGNHLRDTGIIFIWDEFTSYLRTNPNDDTLQPLSEFCKEQPFFMFLIVHRAESWIKDMGEEVYERITHRFHSLNFHVSEHAAYELIANSLRIRPGMGEHWEDVKNELMRRITPSDFDSMDMPERSKWIRELCPFHPMTLALLSVVAQNFAAAERTIFRFMKDPQASAIKTGFLYFINNFEPDGDWRWLTPDFLWDYFFTSESDILHFSAEAQSAYRHFTENYARFDPDSEHLLRVFKAAMLLIALMSSGSIGNLYSKVVSRKISATRSTLYKCFAGQLKKEDVDKYLDTLEKIELIRLDNTANDARIQIPYSGKTDVFNVRKELIIKNNSRHSLLKKNGSFARSIEAKLWDKNRASFGRMIVAACDSATQSVNLRFAEEWCSGDFWSKLFAFVSASGKQNIPLSEVIADALNMSAFGFVGAVSKWESLSDFQKTCVWLWYKVYSSDDHYSHTCCEISNANNDYYSYVCHKAENPEEIPARVRDEILSLPDAKPSWISERNAALSAMSLTFSDEYFAILDSTATPAMRLQLLTYRTHEEKRYAVKVISEILRDGEDIHAAAEMVKNGYPELAAYMTGTTGCDDEIDRYFAWYRTHKLINRYSGEYGDISLERFDSRFKVMNELKSEKCAYFWLDGFGAEYAPLLVHELRKHGITNIDVKIASAILPTDTEHNHQWDESAPNVLKWNKLDTLAHKGVPDDRGYYSCVVKQLAFFGDSAKKAVELLGKYECVVITGDHGSSRLAALGFHDKNAGSVDAPEGWAVRNFGRYCELEGDTENIIAVPQAKKITYPDGRAFLVMNNYQHFSVSGNPAGGNSDLHDIAGEIHGGNSPEERLVAIITIMKTQPDIPELTCTLKSEYASRQKNRTEFELAFSRKITSLEVLAGHIHAKCSETPSGTWSVILEGVIGSEIHVSVVADGMLLPEIAMKVKTKGITINDDIFGGMSL